MAMLTHPHASTPVRPNTEEFERNVREAMRDSVNAISVAWLASECRRARFEETQLREECLRLSMAGTSAATR
jgi:hypothetical protein